VSAERVAPGWWVVLAQELRDVWLGGRGPALVFALSLVLSVVAYLVATNTALNFLEQREAVGLIVQVSVAMGGLLVIIAAADAVSGERDRGTLEALLLAPVSRRQIAAGKLAAALSLWPAAFLVALPYVWFLGRGVGVVGDAVVVGLLVGTLLAVELGALGFLLSLVAGSSRVSLALSVFVLLALFAPTQLSAGAQQGWAGELMLRANPLTAGVHYVGRVLVDGHSFGRDADLLVAPAVAASILAAVVLAAGGRLSLRPGGAR
jgi:ABC-2 type transport system permease protein